MNVLPAELLVSIFEFLDWVSVVRARCVCRTWCEIASDNQIWRSLFLAIWGETTLAPTDDRSSFYELFKHRRRTLKNFSAFENATVTIYAGNKRMIRCIDYDHEILISGGEDSNLYFHRLAPSPLICSEEGEGEIPAFHIIPNVHSNCDVVCLHRKNDLLLTGGANCGWTVSDIRTKTVITQVSNAHDDWIWGIVLDEEAKIVITAGDDEVVKIWNFESHELVKTLEAHDDSIRCIQKDGTHLWTGSVDTRIKCWDLVTGQEIAQLQVNSPVTTMYLEGDLLVSGDADYFLKLFDTRLKGDPIAVIRQHTDWVFCLDGIFRLHRFASGAADTKALVFDLRQIDTPLLQKQESLTVFGVREIRISYDKLMLALGKYVKIYNFATDR